MIYSRLPRFTSLAHLLLAGLVLSACAGPLMLKAQALTPEITAWYLNTSGATGYNNIEADCQRVQYSTNYVYVSCSGIPDYTIGPWQMNPNIPTDQNWVFKITRNPVQNTGALTATGLGNIGILVNGVPIFNALDAMSYNNQGIWHQDANYFEEASFDATGGHPAPQGRYHYHRRALPLCPNDSSGHSAIIGYSFDGFPIYGPFGYTDPNNAGSAIKRIQSSYQLRNISQRTTLPDGTVLQPNQYGPAVSGQYPLGAYIEDYEYVSGGGDLDESNGRFCKTPEYPNGIYAYFATTDYDHESTYPYYIGPDYYGVVVTDNIGPQGGHVTVSEPTTDWTGAVAVTDPTMNGSIKVYPNPAHHHVYVQMDDADGYYDVSLLNPVGHVIREASLSGSSTLSFSLADLPAGIYFVKFAPVAGKEFIRKLLVH